MPDTRMRADRRARRGSGANGHRNQRHRIGAARDDCGSDSSERVNELDQEPIKLGVKVGSGPVEMMEQLK